MFNFINFTSFLDHRRRSASFSKAPISLWFSKLFGKYALQMLTIISIPVVVGGGWVSGCKCVFLFSFCVNMFPGSNGTTPVFFLDIYLHFQCQPIDILFDLRKSHDRWEIEQTLQLQQDRKSCHVFAIEWYHCECCRPTSWPWPKFSR